MLGKREAKTRRENRCPARPATQGISLVLPDLSEGPPIRASTTTTTSCEGLKHLAQTIAIETKRNLRGVEGRVVGSLRDQGLPKRRYYVSHQQSKGSPTGREPYGDGTPIARPEPGFPGRAKQVVKHGKAVIMAKGGRLTRQDIKVNGMQTAEDVLNVIRDRGKRGLPLEDVYRQLYKPDLYLRAYGRIYRNAGAMTKGVTDETVDGMSQGKIETIIEAIRSERYRWTPVRRVEIPKKNGKTRPLGIPTWSDKLLQEVMRSLLEAYYEPQFSDRSHGFRPKRGCHTALTAITRSWWGTRWFIEGDIKGCFDNIDHTILLSILGEKIHDNRFLRLVANLLRGGYMEKWTNNATHSGTPQGGIISPILSNIYLDRLDQYVEKTLLPEHKRGKKRKENLEYRRLAHAVKRHKELGDREKAHELEKQLQQMPSRDTEDPDFRRLHYIRYADDFLLGYAGTKAEAGEIKDQLATFLRDDLKLEMSSEKTLITHATESAARFLGYEIVTQCGDTKHTEGRRSVNGMIGLRIPAKVIEARCALYQQPNGEHKPTHRPELLMESDLAIVHRYQQEYRGYVSYYQLAGNIAWLNKLRWVMEISLTKTLANKYRTSVPAIYRKYATKIQTAYGPRTGLKVVHEHEGKTLIAVFGGIPLRRNKQATLTDQKLHPFGANRAELIQRLLAEVCEVCETPVKPEVHHVRKLADLKVKGRKEKPVWMQQMAARNRKTLVLCKTCHDELHAGRLQMPSKTES
jgi:group II intron reverse transcriptase/maturase